MGTVIVLDMLELVEYPREAVDNTMSCPNRTGLLKSFRHEFSNAHCLYDYRRFTPQGLKKPLKNFSSACLSLWTQVPPQRLCNRV
jgi:hypothetical protein